jgi:uncharacterized protein
MNRGNGGKQLRVVVDTNVYISAFLHPEQPTFQIFQYAAEKRYCLVTSPAIVQEVGRVLREKFGIADQIRICRLKGLVRAAELLTPTTILNVITNDPPDNRILECAIDGKENLIVSGDNHLRCLKEYQGISIIRPTDLLRTLGVSLKK